MADEASIVSSLQIRKGNIDYQGRPTAFKVDVTGTLGPTPGAKSYGLAGGSVDLSQITTPGMCRLQNLDPDNYYEYGLHDGDIFRPLGEVGPGESYVIKLSRNLGKEIDVPGTGTTGTHNTFWIRPNTASVTANVEAFER